MRSSSLQPVSRTRELAANPLLMTTLVAIFIAVPVLLLAQLLQNDALARLHTDALAAEARAAREAASLVRQHIGVIRDQLVAARDNEGIRAAIAAHDTEGLRARLADVRGLIGPDALLVGYEDDDGTLVAIDPPDTAAGQNFAFRDYFQTVLRTREPYVSQVFTAATQGLPSTATVAVPTLRADGSVSGMFIAGLDLDEAADWFGAFLASFTDVYLIDRNGRLITRATGGRGVAERDLAREPAVARLLADGAVTGELADPLAAETRLLSAQRVPEVDWYVMVVESPQTLQATIDVLIRGLLIIRLVLVGLLLGGALLIARASSAALEQVRAIDREREDFLSVVAHELRQPLIGIELLASALSSTPNLTRDEERDLHILRRQARRLGLLMDDLLAVGRMERGETTFRRGTVDLCDVVARVTEDATHPERIELSLPATALPVDADPDRIGQAVDNLVSNALKYSDGPVEVDVRREGETARVDVVDRGVGLTPDEMALLFRKYGRVHNERTERTGGVGLGLYLVRLIAEAHGGAVSVTSDGAGKGSTFTLRMPLVPLPAPAAS